jgi:8-oxo-dGTP diphosphatase
MDLNNLSKQLIEEAEKEFIDRFVVGAVILKNSSVLILKRNGGDFLGGIDELPSGKVEIKEDLQQALLRETKEETNLDITKILKYVGYFDYTSKSGKKTRQFNFLVDVDSDKVIIDPEEHQSFKWQSILKLNESSLTENVVKVIQSSVV